MLEKQVILYNLKVKIQRAVAGTTLDSIAAKRNQKPVKRRRLKRLNLQLLQEKPMLQNQKLVNNKPKELQQKFKPNLVKNLVRILNKFKISGV